MLVDLDCKVTVCDKNIEGVFGRNPDIFSVTGNVNDEASIESCMAAARERFGPIHILVYNTVVMEETDEDPLWTMTTESWNAKHQGQIRGAFLVIKHFLCSTKISQEEAGSELKILSIVVIGGLVDGFLHKVQSDIVKLNKKGRVNAVAPGLSGVSLLREYVALFSKYSFI